MIKYRIHKLIDPKSIDLDLEGKIIATPHSSAHTQMITYSGNGMTQYMVIPKKTKPLAVRTFNDHFGRDKVYRLHYFKWEPRTPKNELSVEHALQNTMTLEKLREMKLKVFGTR